MRTNHSRTGPKRFSFHMRGILLLMPSLLGCVSSFVHLQQKHASIFGVSPISDFSKTKVSATQRSLEDCVCLVTGASRGIGKAIAIELGKDGAIVYITGTSSSSQDENGKTSSSDRRSSPYVTNAVVGGPGTIEETAALVTESGGKGIPVLCDHGNDEDVKALFEQISQEHGRLDMLVNNCFRIPMGGVAELKGGKFWEMGVGAWDAVTTIGLRSHFVASMYSIPLMMAARKKTRGSLPRPFIAMISSFGGISYTFNIPYGVAKAAVDRLAKDMSVELKDEDICVVSFWPGLVYTERTEIAEKNGEWDKYIGMPLTETETPSFTGTAIKAVALDPENMAKAGSYQVVAELAEEYGFSDVNGKRPPSIRSLKFLLPNYVWDESQRDKVPSWMIPDWKLPFWMMSQPPPQD